MTRRLLPAALLLMLTAAAGPATSGQCRAMPVGTVTSAYATVDGEPIERRAVGVSPGVVVAEETQQVGERGWRTGAPTVIPGARRFSFPAGAMVTLTRTSGGTFPCLRESVRLRGPRGRPGTLACFDDEASDGTYESARLIDLIDGSVRRVRLAAPLALVPLPAAELSSALVARRRIRIESATENSARLAVEHGIAETKAAIAFSPIPAHAREIILRDGAVERVGGLDLRVARTASGWTLEPLDERFPRWISYDCDGDAVIGDVRP